MNDFLLGILGLIFLALTWIWENLLKIILYGCAGLFLFKCIDFFQMVESNGEKLSRALENIDRIHSKLNELVSKTNRLENQVSKYNEKLRNLSYILEKKNLKTQLNSTNKPPGAIPKNTGTAPSDSLIEES